KVLAVTSRKRAPTAPEVPTVKEAGHPALELESLVGLFGPRGMPSELRERIAVILGEVAAADPVIATRLAVTGQIVNVRGPVEFAAAIAQQPHKRPEVAKPRGLKQAQEVGRRAPLPAGPAWRRQNPLYDRRSSALDRCQQHPRRID